MRTRSGKTSASPWGNVMNEQEWINLIAADAQRAANLYKYLPSVLIAQTCQETGYGQTDLSQEGIYNTVGMKKELLNDTWKSMYWLGDTYTKRTPEWYNGKKTYISDVFRVYPDYFSGLADFCQFLNDARYSVGGRYKYRDLLGIRDPWTLIEGVRSRGYCTDPDYSRAIMDIIRKHNLTQYDNGGGAKEVEKPYIIDRIAENEWQVPYHNANDAEYLAIHYLGVNGENPDLYDNGYGGHFYVAKTGQCYQAAKVSDELWHVGRGGYEYIHPYARNKNTIGIECATYSIGDRWFFTQATQESCAHLAAWIMSKYNIPMDHLLRHGDITTKHCPSPYIDNPGDGPNWDWDEFRARVAEYLIDDAGPKGLTPAQRIVASGQRHSINFTGVTILVDGIRGRETTRNMIRCLQEAANRDWGAGLQVDGFKGPKTEKAFEGHFIKYGETQFMVTAVEICMYCMGRDPAGVEHPGKFGDGLAKAAGTKYLSGSDILKLVD